MCSLRINTAPVRSGADNVSFPAKASMSEALSSVSRPPRRCVCGGGNQNVNCVKPDANSTAHHILQRLVGSS